MDDKQHRQQAEFERVLKRLAQLEEQVKRLAYLEEQARRLTALEEQVQRLTYAEEQRQQAHAWEQGVEQGSEGSLEDSLAALEERIDRLNAPKRLSQDRDREEGHHLGY